MVVASVDATKKRRENHKSIKFATVLTKFVITATE